MSDRALDELMSDLKSCLRTDLENLVKGDLQAVAQSPDPKAALMQDIQSGLGALVDPVAKARASNNLEEIAKLARENEVHFQAMKNGLSALISRIESFSAASDIGAYDQSGAAMAFQRGHGAYVKKA